METINITQKPKSISIAVNLLWVSMAVGVVKALLDYFNLNSLAPSGTIYITLILTFVIFGLLIWKISSGKNWARIVLLVLYLIGLLPFLMTMQSEFSRSFLLGLMSVVQVCMQGYALFLCYTIGNIWFKPAST